MNTYKEPLYIFIDIFVSHKKEREREKLMKQQLRIKQAVVQFVCESQSNPAIIFFHTHDIISWTTLIFYNLARNNHWEELN